jgi:pimeloyl-ACP methyl ester carboxylesterase
MSPVTPFRIAIPDAKIQRLKQKLALTDFPDEISDLDDPWSRGSSLNNVKRLARYWEKGFDFPKAEETLNAFPQFTTPIEVEGFDTYDIHFVHQQSSNINAIPILFIHGWPGSFVEVTKILPDLVKGGTGSPAFHVVAPSLVDFGFSSANKKASC